MLFPNPHLTWILWPRIPEKWHSNQVSRFSHIFSPSFYISWYFKICILRISTWKLHTISENKFMVTKGERVRRDKLGDWDRHKHTTAAKLLWSCPTLCDPIDGSPPGSPVPEILQARTLEWVAISFSNAWRWKVKVQLFSCVWLWATPWTAAYQAPPSRGLSRQEYWSGVPSPSLINTLLYFSCHHHLVMSDSCNPMDCVWPDRLLHPRNYPIKNTIYK